MLLVENMTNVCHNDHESATWKRPFSSLPLMNVVFILVSFLGGRPDVYRPWNRLERDRNLTKVALQKRRTCGTCSTSGLWLLAAASGSPSSGFWLSCSSASCTTAGTGSSTSR